ncbi:MAG: hypothetical protein JST26_18175 [Bacteroidetes bacterium]|nr:hypothetical protein [Bacteroidota bacterium]
MLKKILLICLSLLGLARLNAQVTVNAVLDTGKIRIGEQAKIDLYLTYDAREQKNLQINWPLIEDTLSRKELEVVGVTEVDTTIPDKNKPNIVQQHLRVTVTAFDSGYFAIAPFKFVLNNDTAKPLYTEAMLLEVHTVPTDSTLTKIKDIKPPFDEPFDWRWYLPYAYIGLGILAFIIILILVIRYLNKNKKQQIVVPDVPKIPAHIPALESLEKIKQEAIWKEGKVKEYYSDIADTVRQYIEGRFHINALELTSDEILHVFRSQVVDSESKEKLRQLLTLSDLAKFAKQTPIEAEHTLTLNNAFDFVNGTKRDMDDPAIQKPSSQTNN